MKRINEIKSMLAVTGERVGLHLEVQLCLYMLMKSITNLGNNSTFIGSCNTVII